MEGYLSNCAISSRRLLTFVTTLFVRLNLARNNYTWNVVRLCVRAGFRVRFDLAAILNGRPTNENSSLEIRDGQIACFACESVAYGSLNEFVHAVFQAYNDRSMGRNEQEAGMIFADSGFFHLPHRTDCDRSLRNVDDLTSYVDLLMLRRLCAAAFASNGAVVRTEGNYICRICMTRTTDVSSVPCGHVYACFDCLLTSLQENRSPTNCFICREVVTGILQLYFA